MNEIKILKVVFKDGSNYRARNGLDGTIDYEGTNAATVLQSVADAGEGLIKLSGDTFDLASTTLTLKTTGLSFCGEGINSTILTYSGTGTAVQIGDITNPYYYINLADIRVNLTSATGSPVGVEVKDQTYYGEFRRLRASADAASTAIGVHFNNAATWSGFYTMYNPHITNCTHAIKTTGAADKSGITLFSGVLDGPAKAAGSVGINLATTNTFRLFGTSCHDFETLVNLASGSIANQFWGLRMETATTGINIAAGCNYNSFFGGSMDAGDITTLVSNAGSFTTLKDIYSCRTEMNGADSIASGTTSKVVSHSLAVTPSAEHFTIIGKENPTNDVGTIWVDTITSTQFTVNVENDPGASNWDFGWKVDASYLP